MLPEGAKIRDYNPETDLNYVTDSWRRSYEHSPWSGTMPTRTYIEAYNSTLRHLLAVPTTLISIVCTETAEELDENFIIGYIVYDLDGYKQPVVHYMYVKEPFRKKGIGKELLTVVLGDASSFKYTFRTRSCDLLRGRFLGQFSPRLINEKQRKKA